LSRAWRQPLGGTLSSPVVAAGKLFVARCDTHTIHALDAIDGRPVWSFTAGGPIDSPPTVAGGCVYFGSTDGFIYCLRAEDGALGWRYRAAPHTDQIVARGQLESAWPVHGSVLVRDGIVYAAAGRSSYLDGGIRLVRLSTQTGQLLSETVIDHRDASTGFQPKGQVKGTNMPGALPDILSSEGESVFMRHSRFDLSGAPQPPVIPHLFSAAGFLEEEWWHRNYTMIGTMMNTNYGGWPTAGSRVPSGRLLVVGRQAVYGFGRTQYIHHGAHVGIDGATVFHFRPDRDKQRRFTHYQAFAMNRQPPEKNAAKQVVKAKSRRTGAPNKQILWTAQLPILARAMVLAGDTVFFAGPPDIFQSDDPHAAWAGKQGGVVLAVSAGDGRTSGQFQLESPPVFEGLAAAHERLYASLVDGSVVCLSAK
jgi:outer membrane protein assembly factor BamB